MTCCSRQRRPRERCHALALVLARRERLAAVDACHRARTAVEVLPRETCDTRSNTDIVELALLEGVAAAVALEADHSERRPNWRVSGATEIEASSEACVGSLSRSQGRRPSARRASLRFEARLAALRARTHGRDAEACARCHGTDEGREHKSPKVGLCALERSIDVDVRREPPSSPPSRLWLPTIEFGVRPIRAPPISRR